jgi:hypothetical protein
MADGVALADPGALDDGMADDVDGTTGAAHAASSRMRRPGAA